MKHILATLVFLSATASMAVPTPGAPVMEDSEAINALMYGAPAAKLADLKAGSNTMVVQSQMLNAGVVRFIFTTRVCHGMNRCLENKQMTVTRSVINRPDVHVVKYEASEVTKLR